MSRKILIRNKGITEMSNLLDLTSRRTKTIRRRFFATALVLAFGTLLVAPSSFAPLRAQHADADQESLAWESEVPDAWTQESDSQAGLDSGQGTGQKAGLDQEDPPEEEEEIYVENHLVVQFEPDATDTEKAAIHEQYGAQVISEIPALNVQVLRLPEDLVSMVGAYQNEKAIRYAEPDYIYHIFRDAEISAEDYRSLIKGSAETVESEANASSSEETLGLDETPNDSMLGSQWHHAKINSAGAWDHSHGDGITVAIIDTGVACTHPDLLGKCVAGYDTVNGDSDARDDHGHGTHVAGLAAANTNNALGVAGTGYNAKIMPVKALNSRGSGDLTWIANAVVWAADNGADVINMSLGGRNSSRTLQDAIAYAIGKGIPVIAAAGNDSSSNPSYPAAYTGVVAVAATSSNDRKANFSNYGSYIDIAAPGVAILSTVDTGSYEAWPGTSMASPIVAGVAALLLEQGPCRTPADIERVLETTALDLGAAGWDQIFGAGRIQADEALAYDTNPCDGGSETPTPSNPVPTTPPTSAPPTQVRPPAGDLVSQLEALINQERARLNLAPISVLEGLRRAAGRHSLDLSVMQACTHRGSDGSGPGDRMRAQGIRSPYGEIVACGQGTPEAAVQAWMASPGHRAIILCTRCTSLGGGYAEATNGYRRYWTVNFAADIVAGPTATLAPTIVATQVPPTDTPTPRPSATQVVIPTSYPGEQEIVLSPIKNRIGWVVSTQPYANNFDSSDTYTGVWNNRIYHGAMQFDLSQIPPGSFINYARLYMLGRSSASDPRTGTWTVNLLEPAIDPGFESHGYSRIHDARIVGTLMPILSARDVDRGQKNIFNFSDGLVRVIEDRSLSSRLLSLRIDGPTNGEFANLLTWDTGYGDKSLYEGPKLVINFGDKKRPVPPTATTDPRPTDPAPTDPPGSTATATAPPLPPTRTPTSTPPPTLRPDDREKIIEIVAQPEDVGWVRQGDLENHLGTKNTYTGYYQTRRHYGMAQFDLSQLPKDRVITHARLSLTGQSTRWLASQGNGRWRIAVLNSDVDAGWHYHGYQRIDDTRATTWLYPHLTQADLDVGHKNIFVFRGDEVRELAFRSQGTERISFRFEGPRAGNSNVFDWDAGYGGNPPKLTIIMGPPTSDNPLPPPPPADQERVDQIISLVNAERGQAGLPALEQSTGLQRAAAHHTWTWPPIASSIISAAMDPLRKNGLNARALRRNISSSLSGLKTDGLRPSSRHGCAQASIVAGY